MQHVKNQGRNFQILEKKEKLQDLKTHPLHFLTVGGLNNFGEGGGGGGGVIGSFSEIFLFEGSFYGQTLKIINGNQGDFFLKSLGESLTQVNHCDNKDKISIPSTTYAFKL